jgi:hypothetical protein
MRPTLVAIPVLLALAACAAPGGIGSTPDPTEADPADTRLPFETAPEETMPMTGEIPEQLRADIVADAARRADIDPDSITVVKAESVTWNDGSLGCPEPGMMYTQALVDGYHVVVRAGDEELDYRADSAGHFRYCENPPPAGGVISSHA